MHRRNYGRKSGIIIDHCSSHGYWFDSRELEPILQWVRKGGEQKVARLEEKERRETDRRQELEGHLDPMASEWPTPNRSSGTLTALLSWLVRQVLYR